MIPSVYDLALSRWLREDPPEPFAALEAFLASVDPGPLVSAADAQALRDWYNR